MQDRQWTGTGRTVEVPGQFNRIPEFDKHSGAHLWTVISMYRWAPGTETPMLDMENLLSVQGPGCYYCEKPYTKLLATRRCTGDPR